MNYCRLDSRLGVMAPMATSKNTASGICEVWWSGGGPGVGSVGSPLWVGRSQLQESRYRNLHQT